MAYIEEANELMTDATGQSIATAIGNMSATSVGNLSALTTTDKTSLVGAVNEVKSGLTNHNGNGNIKYLMIGDILVLTGTITGGGGTDVAIGTPSNFLGVVSVRNISTGVMGTYFVLNGALNGWDGETQTTRTFTNGEEYQVSGNLYRHTS